jgi:hypothetical protein
VRITIGLAAQMDRLLAELHAALHLAGAAEREVQA